MNGKPVLAFALPPKTRRKRLLDCYEFYLWSIGKMSAPEGEEEDVWDYVEGRDKGRDVHGYTIV
jgi:hypothetical protein